MGNDIRCVPVVAAVEHARHGARRRQPGQHALQPGRLFFAVLLLPGHVFAKRIDGVFANLGQQRLARCDACGLARILLGFGPRGKKPRAVLAGEVGKPLVIAPARLLLPLLGLLQQAARRLQAVLHIFLLPLKSGPPLRMLLHAQLLTHRMALRHLRRQQQLTVVVTLVRKAVFVVFPVAAALRALRQPLLPSLAPGVGQALRVFQRRLARVKRYSARAKVEQLHVEKISQAACPDAVFIAREGFLRAVFCVFNDDFIIIFMHLNHIVRALHQLFVKRLRILQAVKAHLVAVQILDGVFQALPDRLDAHMVARQPVLHTLAAHLALLRVQPLAHAAPKDFVFLDGALVDLPGQILLPCLGVARLHGRVFNGFLQGAVKAVRSLAAVLRRNLRRLRGQQVFIPDDVVVGAFATGAAHAIQIPQAGNACRAQRFAGGFRAAENVPEGRVEVFAGQRIASLAVLNPVLEGICRVYPGNIRLRRMHGAVRHLPQEIHNGPAHFQRLLVPRAVPNQQILVFGHLRLIKLPPGDAAARPQQRAQLIHLRFQLGRLLFQFGKLPF